LRGGPAGGPNVGRGVVGWGIGECSVSGNQAEVVWVDVRGLVGGEGGWGGGYSRGRVVVPNHFRGEVRGAGFEAEGRFLVASR